MKEDRFTHTETDAGLYEFRHGDTVYGDDRPTRAEAERDEADDVRDCECCEQGKHQTCLIEVWDEHADDWAPCPCDLRGHDNDPTERDNTARDDDAIDRADTERKERDR